MLLGPSRDQLPDHGPLGDYMARAAHRELDIIRPVSQGWVDSSAVHCVREMVHMSQICTGQGGTSKYTHRCIILPRHLSFLSQHLPLGFDLPPCEENS